jgi:hypothetical protein
MENIRVPTTNKSRSHLVLHPFLFASFPILTLYASNIDQTTLHSALMAGASVLLIAFALFVILRYTTKSSEEAGFTVSLILLAFFSYGHIHNLICEFLVRSLTQRAVLAMMNWPQKIDIYLHIPLLAIFIVGVKGLMHKIVKSKSAAGSKEWTAILNGATAALVIISLVRIGWYEIRAEDSDHPQPTISALALRNLDYKPDIYYIILDGYARADVLQKYYQYDNSQFTGFLESKGFQILEKSVSNYSYTFLSLPSSLNFDYLNYIAEKVGADSQDLRIPYEMIRDNRLVRLLKSAGYKFVHFNSTWGATQSNNLADLQIGYKRGLFSDEYLRILSQTTVLKVFDSLIVEDLAATHRYTFDTLSRAPFIKGPKFVFAHMVLPHHPFIFDREGNVKQNATMADQFLDGGWASKDGYLDQLIFVNRRMQSVIDSILSRSANPPLIIIQSDHGPQIPGISGRELALARMGILTACYLPGGGDALLYPTMTPVNIYRLVLGYYFGADVPMLKDIAYYSEFSKPYKFLFTLDANTETPAGASEAQKTSHRPFPQGGH